MVPAEAPVSPLVVVAIGAQFEAFAANLSSIR